MHYSVDVGLLHLVHLDLSPYWCRFTGCIKSDSCGFPDRFAVNASSDDPVTRYDTAGYRKELLAFVRSDLAKVDRTKTPWIITASHYPLYETYDSSSPANLATERSKKDLGARGRDSPVWPPPYPCTIAINNSSNSCGKAQALLDLEPLLKEHAVDIFFAGHGARALLLLLL